MTDSNGSTAPKRAKRKKLGKYFLFGPSYRGAHGLELENKNVIPPGLLLLGPEIIGGHGFPAFSEKPRLRPSKEIYDRPPKDLEQFHLYWLVSQRLKNVLEQVDPEGVEFADCDVYYMSGKLIDPPHYLCDVTRVIDAIDEPASEVKIRFEPDGRKIYSIIGNYRIILDDQKVGSNHIFIQKSLPGVVCDRHFKECCVESGIKDPSLFDDLSGSGYM